MMLTAKMEQVREQINAELDRLLPIPETKDARVVEAMRYSAIGSGKALRPFLAITVGELLGLNPITALRIGIAIEMLHTYSLIHDDLPAMDNDEYRRGRKTTHVVYGEAMAILAGDALLNMAFETAAKAFEMGADATRVGAALSVFAKKAGIYGMIGGQTADIEAENMDSVVTEELLLFIHEHKTAALIQSAMMTGAILAGASEEDVKKIEKIGYDIGIAFQIQDDILDVTGSMELLGKPIGSDEKNHKVTYVTLKGLARAEEDQKAISGEAIELLSSFENRNLFLENMIESLITRKK